jgi:hypothetical protein
MDKSPGMGMGSRLVVITIEHHRDAAEGTGDQSGNPVDWLGFCDNNDRRISPNRCNGDGDHGTQSGPP